MKLHLVFVIMLMVFIPIFTIGIIWNSLIENENDAIQYRFETILEERLERVDISSIELIDQIRRELTDDAITSADDNVKTIISFDKQGHLLNQSDTENTPSPASLAFAKEVFNRAQTHIDNIQPNDDTLIISNYMNYANMGATSGWVQKMDSPVLDLWLWHRHDDGSFKVINVNTTYILKTIAIQTMPQDIGPQDSIVIANNKAEIVHLWGAHASIANMQASKASITMSFPLNTMRLYYFTDNFPSIDMGFRILILAIACSLILLGAYFLWEHMRNIDDAIQKVSFVNQVSHELKTPLTNIRMYIDLLKDNIGNDNPDTIRKLSIVDSEAVRLSRLITNILTFSNQKNIQPAPIDCDTDEIVTTLVESFRPQLEKHGFTIDLDCKAGTYKLDQTLFEQILVNLISNADKYAGSGGYIGIKTFIKDDNFHLKVIDKGPGIPDNLKESIFKPFMRGDNKTTEGVSGTGLGLFLVKDLTEKQGGSLNLESNANGSTFEVIL